MKEEPKNALIRPLLTESPRTLFAHLWLCTRLLFGLSCKLQSCARVALVLITWCTAEPPKDPTVYLSPALELQHVRTAKHATIRFLLNWWNKPATGDLNLLRVLFTQMKVSRRCRLNPTTLLSKTPKQGTNMQAYTYLTFAIEMESEIAICNYRAPLQLLPLWRRETVNSRGFLLSCRVKLPMVLLYRVTCHGMLSAHRLHHEWK